MKIAECFKKGLLKRTSPDMENALRSVKLAMGNIEDAAENLSIRRYRVVAISSYTAMFHAARAILFRDGVKERSHECIPVYLKEKYPELEALANTPRRVQKVQARCNLRARFRYGRGRSKSRSGFCKGVS